MAKIKHNDNWVDIGIDSVNHIKPDVNGNVNTNEVFYIDFWNIDSDGTITDITATFDEVKDAILSNKRIVARRIQEGNVFAYYDLTYGMPPTSSSTSIPLHFYQFADYINTNVKLSLGAIYPTYIHMNIGTTQVYGKITKYSPIESDLIITLTKDSSGVITGDCHIGVITDATESNRTMYVIYEGMKIPCISCEYQGFYRCEADFLKVILGENDSTQRIILIHADANGSIVTYTDNSIEIDIATAIYKQDTEPENALIGDIWIYDSRRFKLVAEQANSTFMIHGSNSPANIKYSLDDGYTWSDLTIDTEITLTNVGDYAVLKGNGQPISIDDVSYTTFIMTGKIAAYGDIDRLAPMGECAYHQLFKNCTSLTKAPNLPATTLSERCYNEMFRGCTSLTDAPSLPATTLAISCYRYMFSGCTSLTEAPLLIATELLENCYESMFSECINLAIPPLLPATTLAAACYEGMFSSCSSLVEAPKLPATTLVDSCYDTMFTFCTHLSVIEVGFSTWIYGTTYNWMREVNSTGTFICPSTLANTRGGSNIPTGWTKLNALV